VTGGEGGGAVTGKGEGEEERGRGNELQMISARGKRRARRLSVQELKQTMLLSS
jgi:hypothetical protein